MMAEARPAVTSLSRLPSMLAALRQDLVIDESLNVFDLQDLAHKLGELGQRGVIFRAVPAVPFVLGGIDYVKIQQPQANELFARIRGGKRLGVLGVQLYGTPVSPANVTVQVLDNNSNGRAERVVRYLQDAGFQNQVIPSGCLRIR